MALAERSQPTCCRTGRPRGSWSRAGAPPARSGTPSDCRSPATARLRSARSRKSSGVEQRAVVGAQPRERLVVAHLALRQRDDRLEVEVDPVGLDGARELRDDLRLLDAPEVAAPRRGVGLQVSGGADASRVLRRLGAPARARPAARRPAAGAAPQPAAARAASRCGSRFPASARAPRPRRRGPSPARRARRSRSRAARWRRGCGRAPAAISPSMATMRRSSSETWRPMSAVPRDRSAICAPTSKRSRWRPVTELIITSAVITAMATTVASMPVKRERQIEHDADRAGDQHHAERDEDGAQAPHVRPQNGVFGDSPLKPLPLSTSAAFRASAQIGKPREPPGYFRRPWPAGTVPARQFGERG